MKANTLHVHSVGKVLHKHITLMWLWWNSMSLMTATLTRWL